MKKRINLFYASLLAALTVLVASAAAHATPGFVTDTFILRSGPSNDYPAVARVRSGSGVEIQGCLKGWGWCEVAAGPYRGWAMGENIMTNYQGSRYPIYEYGERASVPVVEYQFGPYWDKNYKHKSFYKKRQQWSQYTVPVLPERNSYYWPGERPRHR